MLTEITEWLTKELHAGAYFPRAFCNSVKWLLSQLHAGAHFPRAFCNRVKWLLPHKEAFQLLDITKDRYDKLADKALPVHHLQDIMFLQVKQILKTSHHAKF